MSSEEIIIQDHERPSTQGPARGGAFPKFGCIAIILLGAFVIGILIVGIQIGSKMAQDIESCTDEFPGEIPVERGTPGQLEAIRTKVFNFLDKINSSSPEPAELQLSAHDLNILIANDSYLADIRGTIHLTEFAAPDMIRTQRARPMSHIKFWKPRRYLNAFMDYKLVSQEGNISIFAKEIRIEGREVPDYVLNMFQSQDMLEPYKNDERFLKALKKLKRAWIEGGKLILANYPSQTSTENSNEKKP